jgi:predicted restriction endonuclease
MAPCQVCGVRIANESGTRRAAQVHRLDPWDGDGSDRLSNVICVCPNDHARLELGILVWDGVQLTERTEEGAVPRAFAVDEHLTVALAPGRP